MSEESNNSQNNFDGDIQVGGYIKITAVEKTSSGFKTSVEISGMKNTVALMLLEVAKKDVIEKSSRAIQGEPGSGFIKFAEGIEGLEGLDDID